MIIRPNSSCLLLHAMANYTATSTSVLLMMMTYFSTSVGTILLRRGHPATLFDVLIAIPQQTTHSHTPHDLHTHKGIPSEISFHRKMMSNFKRCECRYFQNSLKSILAILHLSFDFDMNNGIMPNWNIADASN